MANTQNTTSQPRVKDKSFRHVFKGSVLINTLLDYDDHKFHTRQGALKFAQRLLDIGQVESMGGDATFEDSAALYRWCDETVVREAKRLKHENNQFVTATHIPRKKIIELIDLQQAEQGDCPYTVEKTRNRLTNNANQKVKGHDTDNSPSNWNTNNNHPLDNRGLNGLDYHEGSLGETDERKEQMSPRSRDLGSRGQRVNLVENLGHVLEYEVDPLEAWVDRVLENKEHFDTVEEFDRQTSSESDVFDSKSTTDCSKASSHGHTQNLGSQHPLVRYDGIEMPALDLDNLIFESSKNRKLGGKAGERYPLMDQLLGLTMEEGSSFSDNEKQLLQQMRQMQDDHQHLIEGYESQISDLVGQISGLKKLADQLDERHQKDREDQDAPSPTSSVSESSTCPSPPIPPPPPPPMNPPPAPPPPPGLSSTALPLVKGPTKRTIQPRVKMRPLFWSRVLLETTDKDTFWHFATEPNFDVDQFEKLFGRDPSAEKKDKSLHDTMTKGDKRRDSMAPRLTDKVKLLEEKRSRLVAIKLKSLHCSLGDIKHAVYRLDFSRLEVEQLKGLHEIRGTEEEMGKISGFVEENPGATLDEPEAFLLEMTKMAQFTERIECLTFRKNFNESLFDIDQQLDTVQQACKTIKKNRPVKNVLELTLALGNYMNGCTQRGQADAFDLETLAKLRDVKSMDNSSTLLRHIVSIITREHEAENAGKNEAVWKLPDLATITQASQMSFGHLTSELNKLRTQIHTHSRKADIVALNSKPSTLQPFKDQMDDFFESAETMLKGQWDKLEATKTVYQDLLQFLAVRDTSNKMTLEVFFGIWAQFLEDYKTEWKLEQKDIAKKMFEKVESLRKERMRTAKRRKSTVEDGKSNLKQKFSLMRQKTDNGSTTVKLLRSHSISAVDVVADKESCDHHKSPSLSEELSHQSHHRSMSASVANLCPTENLPRVRSRTRQKSLQNEGSSLYRSNSSASVIRNGESMIERMQKRRRNRQESQESLGPPEERSRKVSTVELPSPVAQLSRIGARLSEPVGTPAESIKERMQRRRRERDVAVNQTPEATSPTPILSQTASGPQAGLAIARSVDLASLRQKFVRGTSGDMPKESHGGSETFDEHNKIVDARRVIDTTKDLKGPPESHDKKTECKEGHDKNCNHPTCQAQKMTRAAFRSTSQEQLNTSTTSRTPVSKQHITRASAIELRNISQEDKPATRRRRDSYDSVKTGVMAETESSKARRAAAYKDWKGSQHSLPESDSSSSCRGSRSRLGSRDSWKGSHQSVQDVATESAASSFSVTGRETKSSILRREAAARAKQRDNQPSSNGGDTTALTSGGSRLSRDTRSGWKGSQTQLIISGESDTTTTAKRTVPAVRRSREMSEDSKAEVSTSSSTSALSRRMRDRSYSQQSVPADGTVAVGATNNTATTNQNNTKSSGMRRARDAWRGSQPGLNSSSMSVAPTKDTTADSTSTRAAALRRVLSNAAASATASLPIEKRVGRGGSRREAVKGGRGTEVNSSTTETSTSNKLNTSSTRSALRGSQSSLVVDGGRVRRRTDTSKTTSDDAPSEHDYKEDLRNLSRTRTSLITRKH